MERPIGDKFLTPEGVELEVIESKNSCIGCYGFNNDKLDCGNLKCSWMDREDKKDVIFKQTK